MFIGSQQKFTTKPPIGAQIDPSHPLSVGLIGCWLFNEGGGNNALNLAIPSDAAFVGVPTWGQDRNGSILEFPGSGNYATAPFDAAYNTGRITLAAWIKTTTGAANTSIIDRDNEGSPNRIFQFVLTNSSANLRIVPFYAGAPVVTYIGSATVNDGQWHHVAAVLDGVNAILYVDGNVDFTAAETRALDSGSTLGMRLGAHFDGGASQPFVGSMDTPMIWNRGLVQSEIQWLVSNPFDFMMGSPSFISVAGTPVVIPSCDSWHPAIQQPYVEPLIVTPY